MNAPHRLLCFAALSLLTSCAGSFGPAKTTAADEELQRVAADLKKRVDHLAGAEIGERHVFKAPQLEKARKWIKERFAEEGYAVWEQGVPVPGRLTLRQSDVPEVVYNIVAELPGTQTGEAREIILLGAHYDTFPCSPDWTGADLSVMNPSGRGTAGANDNASGVAALLTIARLMQPHQGKLSRTLRFVAFANEEPPFYQEPDAMGSSVYAAHARQCGERIVAMISLETMALYSEPGSEKHDKRVLSALLPLLGLKRKPNYVAFLNHAELGSGKLARSWAATFAQFSPVKVQTLSLPNLPAGKHGLAWSDDWSFVRHGFPAFAVTDTAYLRSDRYHTTDDEPGRISQDDYMAFASVVHALTQTLLLKANETGR